MKLKSHWKRFFIVDTASDFKRKIIALLDQTFPEYEKLFSDTFGKSSVELLANYTTPEEMLSVAAFKDPAISLFYQKKRSEGKDHLTALGHVSHKILAIVFAVLRDNKPYFPASAS